jgi:hypothetical protein
MTDYRWPEIVTERRETIATRTAEGHWASTRPVYRPPNCYRASWQLPGPDSDQQAMTSLHQRSTTSSTFTLLGRAKA